MTVYRALTLHYNGHGPFVAVSDRPATPGLTLGLNEADGLCLRVNNGDDDDVLLETVGPGDRIRVQFDLLEESVPVSIGGLTLLSSGNTAGSLPEGQRLALAFTDMPEPWRERYRGVRISHPPDGGMQLVLGTVARDHARLFVMAGDDAERWHWQLPDLYSGDAIELEVMVSAWGTTYPDVTPVDVDDDVTGLAILFRTSAEGVPHALTHTLYFGERATAEQGAAQLQQAGFRTDGPWGFGTRWNIRATHELVPTIASLAQVRRQLDELCVAMEYGGWKAVPV